jgi:hypothetical protein
MQYQCQVALEEKRPAAWAAVSLVRGAHHQVGGAVQTGEYAEPIPAIARFASAGGSLGDVAVKRVRLARHDNGPVRFGMPCRSKTAFNNLCLGKERHAGHRTSAI